MKKLIVANKDIVDSRTFYMIQLILQRLYIPYCMIYRGKVNTVSKRKTFWDIHVNGNVNNFQKLVDFLGCLHEFERVGEHKPLKFHVVNGEMKRRNEVINVLIVMKGHKILEIEKPYLTNFLYGFKYFFMDFQSVMRQIKENLEKRR